jgi:hypothetical protein
VLTGSYERVELYTERGTLVDEYSSVYDAKEYVEADAASDLEYYTPDNITKYDEYTLPGASNYKEMLLTLPLNLANLPNLPDGKQLYQEVEQMIIDYAKRQVARGDEYMTQDQYKHIAADPYAYLEYAEEDLLNKYQLGIFDFDVRHLNKELVVNKDSSGRDIRISRLIREGKQKAYQSSHWQEPNILAHIRFNERTDAEGNRVLFIEELQSDWAQEGRKRGFAGGVDEARAALKKFTDDLVAKYGIDGLAEGKDSEEEKAEFARLTNAVTVATKGAPKAPFVTDTKGWLNLALKRMIRYASENGFDKVAFANGKQSADRYSLSKAVNDLSWTDRTDGGRMVMMTLSNNTPVQLIVGKDAVVTKSKNLAQAEGRPLDEIVGKDLATKIMSEKGGDLEGVGLDVGGEGMKSFYDKIVPQAVSSLIKKMGSKVEPVEFRNQEGRFTLIDSKSGQQVGRFATLEAANSFIDQAKSAQSRGIQMWFDANDLQHELDSSKTEQLGFTVTDQMREMAMAGQPLFQNNQGGPRGQIFFGDDMTRIPSVIALLENADLSTFIHESGHFFLQMQADLAARIQMQISAGASVSDGEREIVDDMNRILDWFGIKGDGYITALDKWTSMSLDEQREYHEKWARGFEAYAFEGNAPTAELQSIFQRFGQWMLQIYKQLKNLNVSLTDEVRGVMDRMLATREQIEAAEMARNMGPLFNPQNAQGLIEDWQAYHDLANNATQEGIDKLQTQSLKNVQWMSRAKSRYIKAMQKEHDEVRSEVKREVTREVMSQPIYQLWQFLTSRQGEEVVPGVTQVGETTLADMRGKLRTSVLKEMYGNEADAAWRTLTRLRMTNENGMHPDVLAEIAGFDSGDAMVKALIGALPPAQVIDAMTDQRMMERHAELADPKAREMAADEAVHNEMRIKMLQAEAKALEKAMNVRGDAGTDRNGRKRTFAVLPQAAKQFATRLIGQLRVRDVRASQYTAAAAKSGKEAERAFGAGELEKAAESKRNQIINTYAAKEAFQALQEVKTIVAYLRKFDKKSKGLDYGYYEQIVAILERFDLVTSTSLKSIDKRTGLAEWLAHQESIGIVPDIPAEIVNETTRQHYKNMTVDELRGLRDTIKQLEHLGRLKQKLLTAVDQREFNEIRDRMTESILDNANGRSINNRSAYTETEQLAQWFKQKGIQHMKAAQLARIMDGGKDGGPVWEYLIRTANNRGDWETNKRAESTQALMALLAPVLAQGKLSKSQMFPSIGMSLNRESVLAIALNMGNASNIQRLLGGEGWTIDQIKPVLDTLTAADWQFVQGVWDHFESYRPLIAEKEKRIYGKEPNWIEPQELIVETSDGQQLRLRGGYYPVKYDPRGSIGASQHDAAEQAKADLRGAYTSATTRRSFVKDRAMEVNGRPLLYNLDAIYGGLNEVIHDLAWNEWLIDANRILGNPKIGNAIRETMGHDVWKELNDWVKDIATGDRVAQEKMAQIGAVLRQGVSIAGLGMNVMSAFLQPVGLMNSWSRIGGKWVAIGLKKSIENPFSLGEEIDAKSDFMRNRASTMMRELNELKNQVKGQSKTRQAIDGSAYFLMASFQRLVDIPTWWGAYEKALSEGNMDDRAVAIADQAVIDSQGSGMTKDLSALERGSKLAKLFTVFYSFMNTTLNNVVEKSITTKTKRELAGHLMLLMIVPPVLTKLLKDALTPGDSGDWDDPEKIALTILKEIGSFALGMVVIVREFGGIFEAFGGSPMGDYSGPAGLRVIPDALKLAKQIGQGDLDDSLRKTTINFAGDVLRLPSAQINKTITGINAIADDDYESLPEAAGLVLFGQQRPH